MKVSVDWNKSKPDEIYDRSETFEARACNTKDFANEERGQLVLKEWAASATLICPDFDLNGITLQGNEASMLRKGLHFEISRCNS